MLCGGLKSVFDEISDALGCGSGEEDINHLRGEGLTAPSVEKEGWIGLGVINL